MHSPLGGNVHEHHLSPGQSAAAVMEVWLMHSPLLLTGTSTSTTFLLVSQRLL